MSEEFGRWDDYDDVALVEGCLEWAETEAPQNFDPEFIDDVYDKVVNKEQDLTPGQRRALLKIAKGFEISFDYFEGE